MISEVDNQGLDDLEAEIVWKELNGDEVGVNKEISLIDFDESDQIDEREPKSMFDVFIEKDLIDFGCIVEKLVINDNIKKEIIDENREINMVVNTNSSKMYQMNNKKFESLPKPSCEVTLYIKFAETKFKTDIVLGKKEIVKNLLKVLRDDDSDEFDCDIDLSKYDLNIQFDIGSSDRIMRSVFNQEKESLVKSNCNSRFGDVDDIFEK
ncbi:17877_t:CDS:2, partial [Racocetra persica]